MYWVTGVLGLILAAAPWIFGYSADIGALWTSVIVGAATVVVSLIEGAQADHEAWEYWAAGILGVVAIIAPFVLGFSVFATAMWSTVILGALIAIFSGIKLGSGGFRTQI